MLSESVIHTSKVGGLTIMQDSYSSVVLNTSSSSSSSMGCWRETSELLIKGLASSRASFLLYSGKEVKVYRVDLALAKTEELPSFASSSLSMAISDANDISDEAIFLTEGSTVKILNFAGKMLFILIEIHFLRL